MCMYVFACGVFYFHSPYRLFPPPSPTWYETVLIVTSPTHSGNHVLASPIFLFKCLFSLTFPLGRGSSGVFGCAASLGEVDAKEGPDSILTTHCACLGHAGSYERLRVHFVTAAEGLVSSQGKKM